MLEQQEVRATGEGHAGQVGHVGLLAGSASWIAELRAGAVFELELEVVDREAAPAPDPGVAPAVKDEINMNTRTI